VTHPFDVNANAQILAGLMPAPPVAGLDQDRGRIGGLGFDALDPPAQLPGGPQRIDELQIVIDQQW
jgi:hypothetical protein